jgi:hypothetical protein
MNTDKKVFGRLFSDDKLELASQKYQFTIYDDVKALDTLCNATIKKAESADNKAYGLLESLNSVISESKQYQATSANLLSRSKAIMATLNENAKNFGFDPKASDAYRLNQVLLKNIDLLDQFAGLGKDIANKIITN